MSKKNITDKDALDRTANAMWEMEIDEEIKIELTLLEMYGDYYINTPVTWGSGAWSPEGDV